MSTSTKPQAEILAPNKVNSCNDISFGDHSILEGDRIPPVEEPWTGVGRGTLLPTSSNASSNLLLLLSLSLLLLLSSSSFSFFFFFFFFLFLSFRRRCRCIIAIIIALLLLLLSSVIILHFQCRNFFNVNDSMYSPYHVRRVISYKRSPSGHATRLHLTDAFGRCEPARRRRRQ